MSDAPAVNLNDVADIGVVFSATVGPWLSKLKPLLLSILVFPFSVSNRVHKYHVPVTPFFVKVSSLLQLCVNVLAAGSTVVCNH